MKKKNEYLESDRKRTVRERDKNGAEKMQEEEEVGGDMRI